MKIVRIDVEDYYMLIRFDFWEIEEMGFDVINQLDVSGDFYKTLLGVIDRIVKEKFNNDFMYAIKTYLDDKNGFYFYEIKKYEERLNEFIIEHSIGHGRRYLIVDDEFYDLGEL